MKKIKYSETGKFTEKQIKLCKEIAGRIKKLRKSGCDVIAKQDRLEVFKSNEICYSHMVNLDCKYSNEYPIPSLHAGYINDSSADDQEFFIVDILDLDDTSE